ncbi:MAG: hypothetical protein KF749_13285 [Bacteroidetes bacterium]|nr:hypothetical protein [Bacteroidota bacterium]MCW5894333.1 hypothetical protein [Bacteroidota bacterium]
MKKGVSYKAVMKQERQKYIPKKLLRHENIRVSDKYSFAASVWIADTPESHLRPTVNLTLQHNGDKIRFCFNNAVEMIVAIEQLREWVGSMSVMVNERHNAALAEYLAFHEGETLPPINDYTVYTVIQDLERKRHAKYERVDRTTGEILSGEGGDQIPN